MRVYLDNNIIISIEKNEIDLEDLRDKFGSNTEFVYSYIHIQELLESGIRFDEFKDNRLNTIRKITKNKYLVPNPQKLESEFLLLTLDPELVLRDVKALQLVNREMKNLAKDIDNNREKLVKALEIDIIRLNNYSVNEVIEHINKALVNNIYLDLRTLINCMGVLLHEQICSIFNVLDIVGFWKDKKTEKSNMARAYDSSHAYFASGCNFFVSNDTKALKKTMVAYHFNNIQTTEIIEWKSIKRNMVGFKKDEN